MKTGLGLGNFEPSHGQGVLRGPELLVNGDFSAGTTGWTADFGTIAVTAGVLRVTCDPGGGSGCRATRAIPTVAGRRYHILGTCVQASGSTASIGVGLAGTISISAGAVVGTSSYGAGSSGAYDCTFTATGPSTMIILTNGAVLGNFGEYDNISVKECL